MQIQLKILTLVTLVFLFDNSPTKRNYISDLFFKRANHPVFQVHMIWRNKQFFHWKSLHFKTCLRMETLYQFSNTFQWFLLELKTVNLFYWLFVIHDPYFQFAFNIVNSKYLLRHVLLFLLFWFYLQIMNLRELYSCQTNECLWTKLKLDGK